MRLSTQFKIALIFFIIMLAIIAVSAVTTTQEIAKARSQESLANSIVQGASDLTYLSNDYVVYHSEQQLSQWQSRYASFSNDVGNLSVDNQEKQVLVRDIKSSSENMKGVFDNIVSIIGTNSGQGISSEVLQTSWSRISIQSQTLIIDSTHLAQLQRTQVDQLNLQNSIIIFGSILAFSIFISAIYLQTFRRTLKSISELQAGTTVIGSGNLDYKLKENTNDEIGHLSHSFNEMTTNLKTVTSSKSALEKEIVERKKAEEALKEANEQTEIARKRLETILETNPSAIVIVEQPDGKISYANPRASQLYGFNTIGLELNTNLEKVKPETIDSLPYPFEEVPARRALNGQEVRNEEMILERADGTHFPILASAAPILNAKNQVIAAVVTFEDITERKEAEQQLKLRTEELEQTQVRLEENAVRLEEYATQMEALAEERANQLKEAERMVAIGQTAGMVGHDIRNPLQAIVGDLYLLEADIEEIPQGETKKEAIDILRGINDNVSYINKIIADLQDYARNTRPTLSEVDLKDAIDKAFSCITVPENIQTSCYVEPKTKFMADPAYIRRIITNLSTNAIQAMPNGGKLIIDARKLGREIQITVSDTGEGIPDSTKDKIFKPLFTTKSKGQGFGLAVVKKFVEQLGGTISFDSQIGKGTKFVVMIPPELTIKTSEAAHNSAP